MAEYRIGPFQRGGVQHKMLSGLTTYQFGQQGTATVDPAMDAYETFIESDIEMVGVGLPNSLTAPTSGQHLSVVNNLGTAHKRFVVFALPMVPYDTGSMTKLLNGDYDAQHTGIAQDVIGAGFAEDSGVRCGHEYNAQIGQAGHYNWATGHIDPFDGHPVSIADYKAGAARVENIWRAAGYKGWFIWSGGTTNTSALSIEQAIPTHGDPSRTAWDFDIYPGPKYGTTKNDYADAWALVKTALDKYTAYCRAHGILMGHSEYGHTYRSDSPFVLNDEGQFYRDLYAYWAANADVVAWAGHYQVQQFSGSIVQESHNIAFSVSSSGGSPTGQASAARYTGNYPPGKSDLTSGYGSPPTLADMGSLNNSSNTGLHYVWTTDPNKQQAMTSWRETFGGFGTTGGAAGLQVPITPPVINPSTTPTASSSTRIRRHTVKYQ